MSGDNSRKMHASADKSDVGTSRMSSDQPNDIEVAVVGDIHLSREPAKYIQYPLEKASNADTEGSQAGCLDNSKKGVQEIKLSTGSGMQFPPSTSKDSSKTIPKRNKINTKLNIDNQNEIESSQTGSDEIKRKTELDCPSNSEDSLQDRSNLKFSSIALPLFQETQPEEPNEQENIIPSGLQNQNVSSFDLKHRREVFKAFSSFEVCGDSIPRDDHCDDHLGQFTKRNIAMTQCDENIASGSNSEETQQTAHDKLEYEEMFIQGENWASNFTAGRAIINILNLFNVTHQFKEEEISEIKSAKDEEQFINFLEKHRDKIIKGYISTVPAAEKKLSSDRDTSKNQENDNDLFEWLNMRKKSIPKELEQSDLEQPRVKKSKNPKTYSKSSEPASNVTENRYEKPGLPVPVMASLKITPDSTKNNSTTIMEIRSDVAKKYLADKDTYDKYRHFIIKELMATEPSIIGTRSLNLVVFNDRIPDTGSGVLAIPEFYDVIEREGEKCVVKSRKVNCYFMEESSHAASTFTDQGPPGYEESEDYYSKLQSSASGAYDCVDESCDERGDASGAKLNIYEKETNSERLDARSIVQSWNNSSDEFCLATEELKYNIDKLSKEMQELKEKQERGRQNMESVKNIAEKIVEELRTEIPDLTIDTINIPGSELNRLLEGNFTDFDSLIEQVLESNVTRDTSLSPASTISLASNLPTNLQEGEEAATQDVTDIVTDKKNLADSSQTLDSPFLGIDSITEELKSNVTPDTALSPASTISLDSNLPTNLQEGEEAATQDVTDIVTDKKNLSDSSQKLDSPSLGSHETCRQNKQEKKPKKSEKKRRRNKKD